MKPAYFNDLIKYIETSDEKRFLPFVPKKTYKNPLFECTPEYLHCQLALNYYAWEGLSYKFNFEQMEADGFYLANDDETPVLMRGAWWLCYAKWRYSANYDAGARIKRRYIKFNKLTALNWDEAADHSKRLMALMEKPEKSYKRGIYFTSHEKHNRVLTCEFYEERGGFYHYNVNGAWHKSSVCPDLYAHRYTEEEEDQNKRYEEAELNSVWNKPTDLYRYFDKSGNLLYVGISINTVSRMASHRSASSWYDQAVKITIKKYKNRKNALNAERKAIMKEKPKYNITYNEGVVIPIAQGA